MEPLLGQITAFGFNFSPRGWAGCDGQLLAINSNQSLYSLLGTTYGGDGRTTFALPDLRGCTMVGSGQGPGLPDHRIGSRYGVEVNRISIANMPSHSHAVMVPVNDTQGGGDEPTGHVPGNNGEVFYASTPQAGATYKPFNTGNTGAQQDVNNMQPYTVVNICIAIQGSFPSRN